MDTPRFTNASPGQYSIVDVRRSISGALLTLTLILLPSSFLRAQGGGLTPTQGNGALDGLDNPQPNLRSLEEVEPRIPIASIPFTIDTPGSYFLTASLASATDGIVVNADDVTIDLKGFTLTGSGISSNDIGVFINSQTNVTVKNGAIRGFGTSVELDDSSHCRLEELRCLAPAGNGIFLDGLGTGDACDGNAIVGCSVADAGATGFLLSGAAGGQCRGNIVDRCIVASCGSIGLSMTGANTGLCQGNRIENCSISDAASFGVSLGSANGGAAVGNVVRNCTIVKTGSTGITASGTTGRIEGNVFNANTIFDTVNSGISLSNADRNRIEGNTISGVSNPLGDARGISLISCDENRIQANHVTNVVSTSGSDAGIRTSNGVKNMIFRNTVLGVFNNFNLDVDDTFGPEVTTSGALATTGAGAHPWANFAR